MTKSTTVVGIDKPRCSWCKRFCRAEDLNGIDPFAPPGRKYQNAYHRWLKDCDSPRARQIVQEIHEEMK